MAWFGFLVVFNFYNAVSNVHFLTELLILFFLLSKIHNAISHER